jgi:hypothetical protein
MAEMLYVGFGAFIGGLVCYAFGYRLGRSIGWNEGWEAACGETPAKDERGRGSE